MIDRGRKIRWGILGCGKIAHKFANDLLLNENSILVACASRDKNKSEQFAAKFHANLFFDNYEDLARCNEIDVIYIATPNSYHLQHTLLCLKNKKAVLCEKPLGTNLKEVEEMIFTAKENNVFFMEAMWTAFLPNVLSVKDTISSGAIGSIVHINSDFGFTSSFNSNSRLFDPELGGGSLLDIGIYPIFISLFLLGKPLNVQSSIRDSISGVDASCTVLLTFSENQTASLFSSFETTTDTKCEIYGTLGKIIIKNRFHEKNEHIISIQGKPDELIQFNPTGFGYYHEIEHVNQCLYLGLNESPIMSFETSLNLIKIMDEIRFKAFKV